MDPKEERFLAFWERHKDNKWRFRFGVGAIFGLFMLIVFGIKTYFFGGQNYTSILDYLGSKQFLIQFIFLGLISGWLYAWFMYRYCARMYQKIKDKHHGS